MIECPNCGKQCEPDARFCSGCGTPLGEPERPAAPTRKLATLVFTDVTGSTEIAERLDPEAVRETMNAYFETAREVLERHGGTVEKFVGDAVMAAFGIPKVREDDALRAVRAAAELRAAMAKLGDELEQRYGARLQIRTGVNTGKVIAGDPSAGQAFVSGDPVNVAARLEQAAPPGEVLVGEPTYRLVRDAISATATEPLELKGKSEPLQAYLLGEVKAGEPGRHRRFDLPLIGREDQLLELEDAFERAVSESRCELVTVYADAGTGKTRLARALAERLGERARTLEGRCSSYQDGGALWPLKRALEREAGALPEDEREAAARKLRALAPAVAEEIGPLLSAFGLRDRPSEEAEIMRAARILLTAMATERPLLFILDDLHWAGEALVELLRYLGRVLDSAPLLVCCLAREELRERHPEWDGGPITLSPLSPSACRRMIAETLEADPPAGLAELVAERAGGNPLFVVEILEALIEQGSLRRANGAWAADADLDQLALPTTVEALLSARIEALSAPERAVIEAGAVAGEVFWDGAIAEIDPGLSDLERSLHALLEKGMIGAERSAFSDQRAFRFAHGLVREATYQSIAKRRRADLHERLADWLEARTAERAGQNDQIVGSHLEAAYRYLTELGPADDRAEGIARRAGALLGAAGIQAGERGEISAARGLLERATALLPDRDAARAELLRQLARAHSDLERSLEVAELAKREADRHGDERTKLLASMQIGRVRLRLGLADSTVELRQLASNALTAFAADGDAAAAAEAEGGLMMLDLEDLQLGSAVERFESIDLHALPSTSILSDYGTSLVLGPVPVEDAVHRLERVRERAERTLAATVEIDASGLAALVAMRGEFDRARELCAGAEAFFNEFDDVLGLHFLAGFVSGPIERMAGDLSAAEQKLRNGTEGYSRAGHARMAPLTLADLAQVLFAQSRFRDAETAIAQAREATVSSDPQSRIRWRAIAAKLAAHRGEIEQGEALGREAVAIAAATDALTEHAAALLDLAYVLRAAGRGEEAADAAREALALYEAKGHLVGAGWARGFLDSA